jgi:DNA helicase-2/ATP-dependent DNA helicase PcrA
VPLTPAQARVVTHPGGPLLVLAGAGTGKTTVLVERCAWLVRERALAPESVLLLAPSAAGADDLRERLEGAVERPYEELAVHTFGDLCARLLHDEALEAGLDPFVVPVAAGDRLAMLLERVDELALRAHDLAGSPAALLAAVVARVDRLKEELVTATAFARWARALPEDNPRVGREREFAELYLAHDRLLAEQGALDAGDLVLRALALLHDKPHVRARCGHRYRHVLVDDVQDASTAALALVEALAAGTAGGAGADGDLIACADDDRRTAPVPRAAGRSVADLRRAHPDAPVVRLERSFRCPQRILTAAHAVVAPAPGRIDKRVTGEQGGVVAFWRCANERAQAQAVAAEVERLVRAGTPASAIAVLVRSVRTEGRAIAVAFDERAVPYRLVDGAALFAQAEVRDLLAWLRLLVDPGDAGAVVRALSRPPIGLRPADLARCIQIARRRKLDMVAGLVAATESPQLPPEARDRILAFLKLHRAMSAALDTARADLFVHRLIERLGLRRQQLFAAQADVVASLVNLARFAELAARHVRRAPQATPREFAHYVTAVADAGLGAEHAVPAAAPDAVRILAMDAAGTLEVDHAFVVGLHAANVPGARRASPGEAVPDALLDEPPDGRETDVGRARRLLHLAMTRARSGLVLAHPAHAEGGAAQPPSPMIEEAREALGAEWDAREEELFGPEETLHATFQALRDRLLADVASVGTGLADLRFDTDLDVTHAVVRYLELVKVAALLERPAGSSVADALPAVNARLAADVSPLQREVLATSGLDELLLDAERHDRARAAARTARTEPSLEAFIPRRGEGLLLSASDVETYRTCPLKYKFARVFRIPQEPTLHQRFGILVHQVLERYHSSGGRTVDELIGLLESGWRRGGFGEGEQERQLHRKAHDALRRYHGRIGIDRADPVWFERAFTFRLGPHTVRGRVDRVDRLADGAYELIDYKTGRPRSVAQLREDVQLSLYAIAAQQAWHLETSDQAYLYVLDDAKVRVPTEEIDPDWITETVLEVADGIAGQGFEPTPSHAACSVCDFRIACPAAER